MQTIKEIRAEKSPKIIEEGIKNELPKRAIAAQLNIQLATLDTYLKVLGLNYKGQQAKKDSKKVLINIDQLAIILIITFLSRDVSY